MNEEYRQKMICMINKLIMDELSAAIFYEKAANELHGIGAQGVQEELKEHAKEEIDHFNRLLAFASSHGIIDCVLVELDRSVVDFPELKNIKKVVRKVQDLERETINDYSNAAVCAKKMNDMESQRFFSEIMQEEIDHFDELAYVNGDSRPLTGLKSISVGVI